MLRMTLRMTFKTWDFLGVMEGDLRGDFKEDTEGDLLPSSDQVRSGPGLVQVTAQI